MNDAGYTLAEALVALMMISLAIGGLSVGIGVLAGAEGRTADTIARADAAHLAQAALERALQPQGAFRSRDGGRLTGAASGFSYACGEDRPCRVDLASDAKRPPKGVALSLTDAGGVRHLALRQAGPAHFVYQGEGTTLDAWPPTDGARQALRAILLVRDGAADEPLLAARLWAQQPARCDFDVVMQDCR
jgi:hypothetical protein